MARYTDRAPMGLQRPERFRAHFMTEPRIVGADAPSDEPSGNQDPPASPPHADRFGGDMPGNFRGNPPGKRQSDRAQRELCEMFYVALLAVSLSLGIAETVGLILTPPPPRFRARWMISGGIIAQAARGWLKDGTP